MTGFLGGAGGVNDQIGVFQILGVGGGDNLGSGWVERKTVFQVKPFTLKFFEIARIKNEFAGNALKKERVGGGHTNVATADNGNLEGFSFKHSFSIAGR